MACPYCHEDVKDAAVVCRHCGRDLSAFKLIAPALEKVSALEERLLSLEKQLASSEIRAPDTSPSPTKPNTRENGHGGEVAFEGVEAVFEKSHIYFWSSVLFCAVVPLIAHLLLDYVSGFWVSLFILMLPLAVGFEAGYYWSERHWAEYLLAGVFVGSLSAFELWVVFDAKGHYSLRWANLDWAAVASGFAVAALFISGVLFGDIYEARNSATKTRSSAAATAAAAVFSFGEKEPSPKTNTLVQLVETLGPASIGTFGTIITALLSYVFTQTPLP